MDAAGAKRVIAVLNEGVSNELGGVIQYLWHHYMAEGTESPAIVDLFEKVSRDEMKHLEQLAERVVALGGEPTTQMRPIRKGGELRQMVQDDLELEYEARELYRRYIPQLAQAGDSTSRRLVEAALADEEEHIRTFEVILSRIRKP